MSDDNMKVAIDLDVRSTGEELVAQLNRQLSKLESRIRSINSTAKAASQASRPASPGRNPSSAGASTAQGEAKAQRQALLFDREHAKAFKTRIASQARAASDAIKAEAQSFKDFRTRNDAQSRFESAQVRALRERMTAESRIARMRSSAENDAIRAVKAGISAQNRAYRQRVSEERSAQREQVRSVAAAARAEAQRFREAAASIRENARIEAAQVRHVERERSRHESARNRYISNVRSGANEAREGAGRVVRGSAAISAVGTGAAVAAARKGVSTRMEVDTAETNLKIFSGQTKEQIEAARKGFLDNLSIKNGLGIAGGLDAYSEVLKTGMKSPAENIKTIMEAVSALELDLKNTTKLAGLIDRNYGAKSDPAKIKSALNAIAVAAREDPTQSNEIVEGVKRAFGALSTGNMTPEQLTALVSGGQSVGIQPGKAGTYVATLGKQLSMGNSKFLGKKNRQELDFAARELGFGDARRLASEYSSKSYDTIIAVQERMAKMEAGKRTQVAEALMGRQWSDEALQFSQGVGGVKKTYGEITDSKNANFLEEAARQRAESLQGQLNSTKSIIGRFWDAFGQGFEDILSSINRYFLELNSSFDYDKVKSYVISFFDGVKEALGVKTWQDFLHNVFGGDIGNIGPQIRAFAKGLTEGVMSIGRAIKSFASVFGGSDLSAETVGRLSGQFLALTASMVMLAPVLSILGGLASIVVGLAVAARGIAGLAGLGSTVAAGAGAGLMKGLGLALSHMFALTVVAEIGANRGVIATWMLDAGKSLLTSAIEGLKAAFSKEAIQSAMRAIVNEVVPAPIQRMFTPTEEQKGAGNTLLGRLPKGIPATPAAPVAPTERGYFGRAWDWLSESLIGKANASEFVQPPKGPNPVATPSLDPRPALEGLKDAVNDNTQVLKQSYEKASGFGGLIHKATISTTGPADAVRSSMSESASSVRNAVLSGSVGTGSMTGGNGPLGNSVPGSPLSGGGGLSRRGIIGGGGDGGGYAPPSTSMAGKTFDAKAPGIMANLQKDFGLTKEQAAGILGNLGHESAGMTAYQEGNPRGGGRGGAGWAQWTGPRRRAFEAWSASNGLNPRSDEANYGFLRHELNTTHKGALASLRRQSTVDGATVDFERTYEAAGVKHYGSRLGYARKAFNGPATPSQVIGGTAGTDAAANVADNASKLVGLGSSQAARALGSKMTPGSWCGDFVNGALKSANIKGINSSIANSFLDWGQQVTDGVKKGDVLVEHRGRGVGMPGGHAGIATGQTRQGPRGLQYEMVSGNHGNRVGRSWEDAGKVVARRAAEAQSINSGITAKAEAVKSSGWKKWEPGDKPIIRPDGEGGPAMEKRSLADSVPPRNIDSPNVSGHRGGGGSGGASSSSSATINVNGAGMSAEAVANAVQRRLNEGMNRRTHDLDPSMI